MTNEQCEVLSERMPLVVHGQAEWSAEESAHLAGCADCAAEWRLVQSAATLGASAAARIDPTRLAKQVQAEVAARTRAARWKRGGWVSGLAAAAAVALVLWSGRSHRPVITAPPPQSGTATATTDFTLPMAELEGLDSTQLEQVLDGLDAPVGASGTGGVPSFGDLDDTQLERVLRSLEG
jgi:hypothetical protein